jgi:pyrroline-5-carboxylate reductase
MMRGASQISLSSTRIFDMAATAPGAVIASAACAALKGLTVAFVGGGNMATALAQGVLAQGVLPASSLRVSSPSGGAPALRKLGVPCFTDNADAVRGADMVILCVKPWVVAPALASIAGALRYGDLTIVSVAAGVSMAQISAELNRTRPDGFRIVRAMPNTPCAIGEGASALCANALVTPTDLARARALFAAVGSVESVTEGQLDAVTGLSGSGPAFCYMFIEGLADGGVAAGLPRGVAMALAAQMVRGAAAMVQQSGRHPGELKDAVASPGGTTIAGIHELERGGFRGAVMSAVTAAAARSRELGAPAR